MTGQGAALQHGARVLGHLDSGCEGVCLVAVGGIHGNESAGVAALRRVVECLHGTGLVRRGQLWALSGNLGALDEGERYLDRDLNRAWLPEDLAQLRAKEHDLAEDREQAELIEIFERAQKQARGPVVFVDLHTSSAAGAPFCCLSDTRANRRVGLALPIPMILGLEECVDGAVLEYFNGRKLVSLAIEGGRHEDTSSVENLESAVLLVMRHLGLIDGKGLGIEERHTSLAREARGLPRVLEVLHREVVKDRNSFRMRPGFQSFKPVSKGTELAEHDGELRSAPMDCRVLLPLYQGKGEDGYFLVRRVPRIWLRVATVARILHLHEIVHWMPGVRRHPERPRTLIVQPRIARLFVVQIFHLLGFRRRRKVNGLLEFSRR